MLFSCSKTKRRQKNWGKKFKFFIKVLLLVYTFMSISSFSILTYANEQEELNDKIAIFLNLNKYSELIKFLDDAISKSPILAAIISCSYIKFYTYLKLSN